MSINTATTHTSYDAEGNVIASVTTAKYGAANATRRTVQQSGVLPGLQDDPAVVVSARLDPRDLVLLDLAVTKRGLTRSEAVREIVLQWLADTYDKAVI